MRAGYIQVYTATYGNGLRASRRTASAYALAPQRCTSPFSALRIDPVTLQTWEVFRHPEGPTFGAASTALRIGDEYLARHASRRQDRNRTGELDQKPRLVRCDGVVAAYPPVLLRLCAKPKNASTAITITANQLTHIGTPHPPITASHPRAIRES